jgi:hypothetical protein
VEVVGSSVSRKADLTLVLMINDNLKDEDFSMADPEQSRSGDRWKTDA